MWAESSFTHAESNLISIKGFDGSGRFEDVLRGKIKADMALELLHEMTHHWTFHSPVGSALAYLEQMKRYSIMYGETLTSYAKVSTRVTVATSFLRPISEGLALLAEFDLMPGNGNLRITPLSMLFLMSSGKETSLNTKTFGNQDEYLAEFLQHSRSAMNMHLRRENLLSSPLTTASGGYLQGYLALRSLHQKFRSATHSIDLELFIAYIRSYFFEDLALTRLLLDQQSELADSYEELTNYLTHRFEALMTNDFSDNIKQFEAYITTQDPMGFGESPEQASQTQMNSLLDIPGLNIDRGLAKEGIERVLQFMDTAEGMDAFDAFNNEDDGVANIMLWARTQRVLLCLFSTKAKLTVESQTRVTATATASGIMVNGSLESPKEPGEYHGVLSVFILPNSGHRFLVGSYEAKPLLLKFLGASPPDFYVEQLKYNFLNREFLMEQLAEVDLSCESLLDKQPAAPELKAMQNDFAASIDAMVSKWSLSLIGTEMASSTLHEMKQFGIYQLFPNLAEFKAFVRACEDDTPAPASVVAQVDEIRKFKGLDLSCLLKKALQS